MAYKVFISYSTKDRELIEDIAEFLPLKGITPYIAEWDVTPGKNLPRKVVSQIRNSDCVVAILTKGGKRSEWVNQEIGCALGLDKLVIPFVEKGVRVKGFLEARECIRFDPSDPESLPSALEQLTDYLDELHLEKQAGQRRGMWILGGLVLLSILFPGNGKEG